MKIVHAADLHLDSPLRGLPAYEGAPVAEVRGATRRALVSLIDLCFEQEASLLLLAGDLYDGDFKDYSTALFLVEQLSRLADLGCRVVWLRGNHDAQSQITRHLRLPELSHELSTNEPETKVFEQLGVAVHGQGYVTRDLRENLALRYPQAHAGLFNIGLLHTALDGRQGHALYAPCSASELWARGYDYWALGHVHAREVIEGAAPLVFPGNLQGRHVKETGPKGATVLTLENGRLSALEHHSVDVVRWAELEVDARAFVGFGDAVDAASRALDDAKNGADGRILACRIRFLGRTRAHAELGARQEELLAELRRSSIESGAYLERVQHKTEGELLLETLAARGDALAGLFQRTQQLLDDGEALEALKSALLEPLGSLSTELLREELADFRELVEEAQQLLEGRLLEPEAAD